MSDLTGKLKDALDRECYAKTPQGYSRDKGCPYRAAVTTVCFCCLKNRDLAQELADIAEEHYKAERKVEV